MVLTFFNFHIIKADHYRHHSATTTSKYVSVQSLAIISILYVLTHSHVMHVSCQCRVMRARAGVSSHEPSVIFCNRFSGLTLRTLIILLLSSRYIIYILYCSPNLLFNLYHGKTKLNHTLCIFAVTSRHVYFLSHFSS